MLNDLPEAIKGGVAIDDRPKAFVPPTAEQIRLNLVMAAMNHPGVQRHWADAMQKVLNGLMRGQPCVDVRVPTGGAGMLGALGYYVTLGAESDGFESVTVALGPPNIYAAKPGRS